MMQAASRAALLSSVVALSCGESRPPVRRADQVAHDAVVRSALNAIEACYHWGGEVGAGGDERQREIEIGIKRDCLEAQRLATDARSRHPESVQLELGLMKLNEMGYFDLSAGDAAAICSRVAKVSEKGQLSPDDADYYGVVCDQRSSSPSKER